jgi:thiol-disulfide isomerase/thioredoxin
MRTQFLSIFFLLVIVQFAAAQAPDFTVTDSDGKTHHLYADYVQKGKVVVFEIFFIGCPPCAAHAPHIQNLYQSVKNDFPGRVEFFLLSDKVADTNPWLRNTKRAKR